MILLALGKTSSMLFFHYTNRKLLADIFFIFITLKIKKEEDTLIQHFPQFKTELIIKT
jgi:hypothetical protein